MGRWVIPVAVAALVLTACDSGSDAGDVPSPAGVTEPTAVDGLEPLPEGTTSTRAPAPLDAGGFPCDLVTLDSIASLTAGLPAPGSPSTRRITENGASRGADVCSWLNLGDEALNVSLVVSRDHDFPSGSVECLPPPGRSQELGGLGTRAFWVFLEAGGVVSVGVLRTCSEPALVDVEVSGSGTEAGLQQVTRGIAEAALASLHRA